MTKIEHIECYGKHTEIWYFPEDLTIERWENFLENHSRGNETFIVFQEKDGRIITINPSEWGSVEVKRLSEPLEHTDQLLCEWCSEYSGDISAEKWLSCEEDGYTHHYLSQQPANYCPNCGQAIDWSEE